MSVSRGVSIIWIYCSFNSEALSLKTHWGYVTQLFRSHHLIVTYTLQHDTINISCSVTEENPSNICHFAHGATMQRSIFVSRVEVDPVQTESLACKTVNSSPPDPCICAQQMVCTCRLSMRSLNRSGCARARADDSGIRGARVGGAGGARVTCARVTCACILALLARYLHSGVTDMHACICARMRAL